jgi:nucleotide-binding universal stress UspA family protein
MTGVQPVVVGLDDSAAGRAALAWAAELARATQTTVRAVHVLDWPVGLKPSAVKSGTRLRVPAEEVSDPYLRGMQREFDDVASPPGSELWFAQGDPADVLVRLSAESALLVVGTRAPIQRRAYLAGSTSHYCVSHALCPVVTVPAPLGQLPAESRHHDGNAFRSRELTGA